MHTAASNCKEVQSLSERGGILLVGHKPPFSLAAAASSPQPFLAAAAWVEQHTQPGGRSSGSAPLREFISFFVRLVI